ncbi:MAG: hypothetical protein IPK67_01020 [Planctomycetes bacterium]|jgi:hypothetical protein|nr:hypothetical protein [Planctomycetota bacterium]
MVFHTPRAYAALAVVVLAGMAVAQIVRLDLPQMVASTDDAVLGTIKAAKVFRTDGDKAGQVQELYFTTLTIEGRSLSSDGPLTVDVTFPGGMISPKQGAYNSEAPAAADIQVGNRVVAFFKHVDDLGNGLSANALYASHGGLYRVFTQRGDEIVQGRGNGYALAGNWRLADLDQEITRLAGSRPRTEGK